MLLPNNLLQAIEQAYTAMLNHPQHDLNLGNRHSIWVALGARINPSSMKNNDDGLKKRTTLAILSTQHILSLWESIYPENALPHQILKEAEKVLVKEIDSTTAWNHRNKFWNQIVDLGNEDEQSQIILGVALSAVQALTTALQDENFDPLNINYNLTDADIDPDDMDASFFAASVYANGAVWNLESGPLLRREFWEWWLKQAVPLSWNSIFGASI